MKFKPRKRSVVILLVLIAALWLIWWLLSDRSPKIEYTTVAAVRGRLEQTVSQTGTIKAIDELSLNFLSPGKIIVVSATVGQTVKQGDVLAKLDDSDYVIKLREANANLAVAQARLDKLLAGASAEDIAVAEANHQAAARDLLKTSQALSETTAQAERFYKDLLGQNYGTKSTHQQAYENRVSSLLTSLDNKLIVGVAALDAVKRIIDDQDIKNYLSIRDITHLNNTRNTYEQANAALNNTTLLGQGNMSDTLSWNKYYVAMTQALNLVFKTINYCFNALEYSITSTGLTQTQLDAFKNSMSAQSSAIAAAITSLESAKQSADEAKVSWDNAVINAREALNSAKNNEDRQVAAAEARLQTAAAQLKQVAAKARPEDLALARGQVMQARSAVDLVNNQIINSVLLAPIDGVVARVNYKVGEQTQIGQPVAVMIAENHYEIEIDVSETDIAKIKIGDPAEVTLDAYGDTIKFVGSVIFIEPAETVIQGVTYYKVKVDFTPGGREVKSGMTATAEIKTAVKDSVIMIPARAIINKEGGRFVQILVAGQPREVGVDLGLPGDGGLVEILTGINEGDAVITYTKENGKK